MKAIEIKTTGSVGIAPLGYNPTEKLDINGNIRFKGKLMVIYKLLKR